MTRIWFDIGATPYQYYPLVHTSYWFEYRLWRLDPAGYHTVNVMLHGLVAILVWRLLAVLSIPGAWVAAVVFALHPVHVESVAWVTERKNVLSGVFCLGSALAFARFALSSAPRQRWRRQALYGGALALFLCALLSKTATAPLPVALLLIIWWKRARIDRRDVVAVVPFLSLALAFGATTALLERRLAGAVGADWDHSFLERCLIAGRALWFYVSKLFWPAKLTFVYPRWEIDVHDPRQFLYPLAFLATIAALWLARRRVGRAALAAALIYAGMVFPALSFFNVYYMRYSYVADHWQYLASISLIALAVGGAASTWRRRPALLGGARRWFAAVVTVALIAILGMLTWHQTRIYHDIEALWKDTLAKNPGAWIAHHFMGNLLVAGGMPERALEHYTEEIRLKPDYAPGYTKLGMVLLAQGRTEESLAAFGKAAALAPESSDEAYNLANALLQSGRAREAVPQYERALTLAPGDPHIYNNLGLALDQIGDQPGAAKRYRQALRIDPELLGSMIGLAWIQSTSEDPSSRDGPGAVRLAARAAERTMFRDPIALDTLAAAHAEAGQFDQALQMAALAVQVAAGSNPDLAVRIQIRQGQYEQHRPYRGPR